MRLLARSFVPAVLPVFAMALISFIILASSRFSSWSSRSISLEAQQEGVQKEAKKETNLALTHNKSQLTLCPCVSLSVTLLLAL